MPNKTTTKKANNKSSLKKRFDLTNKKVQFFVVIAIVAVLGGGYFTVRSFASTGQSLWPATEYGPVSFGPATKGTATVNGKSGTTIWTLRDTGGNSGLTPLQVNGAGSNFNASAGSYRYCALVRGNGDFQIGGNGRLITVRAADFTKVCGDPMSGPAGFPQPSIWYSGGIYDTLSFANATIEQVTTAAPAK